MPNVENINKIITSLQNDNGDHFIMSNYADYLKEGSRAQEYVHCNTAMCICGWANYHDMVENKPEQLSSSDFGIYAGYDDRAINWLDIAYFDGEDLFYLKHDSQSLFDSLYDFDGLPPEQKRAAGIKVLETLRDTGEVDWPSALAHAGIETTYTPDDDHYQSDD